MGKGQATLIEAARLKIFVAVENFKVDLSQMGLTEEEMDKALEEAINRAVEQPITITTALGQVRDEVMRDRTNGSKEATV